MKEERSSGFLVCGGRSKSKQESIEPIYRRVLSHQEIFTVVGVYQNRRLKEDLVYSVLDILEKSNMLDRSVSKNAERSEVKPIDSNQKEAKACDNCELMKAVSVSPNGYIAKKLLSKLEDVEWIGGILHKDGKIVDKSLTKAI
jgi:Fe2+ or Zn2+ uptake regulation protein